MQELFQALTRAVEGSAFIAIGASAIWGILSIVLSPCHLASIPLIVGYISGQSGGATVRRALATAAVFALGILATIAAIGGLTAAAGRMLGDIGPWGNYLVAAVFLAVGLYLLEVIPLPWSGPGQVAGRDRGLLGALILGLLFGVAVGPCTFAYMAPMLGVIFKVAAAKPIYAIQLVGAFGLGHCAVIVLAGTFTGVVQRYLDWNERSRGAVRLKKACGVLVILGGLYLVYSAS